MSQPQCSRGELEKGLHCWKQTCARAHHLPQGEKPSFHNAQSLLQVAGSYPSWTSVPPGCPLLLFSRPPDCLLSFHAVKPRPGLQPFLWLPSKQKHRLGLLTLPNTEKEQKRTQQREYMEHKQSGLQSTGLESLSS